ncbi:substrate-binding domain-containing protein [Frankia sp. AgB32]|nr:substrate-binding domain-containing protein [Frankia sp. AgB32]
MCGTSFPTPIRPPTVRRSPTTRCRSAPAQICRSPTCTRARALDLPPPELCYLDHRASDAPAVVRAWLADGITGVVAYNDDAAAAVVGTAIRAGLRVPADLAVVGNDDAPLASLFVPALTTVRLDTALLGRWLAEYVLHRLRGSPPPAWPAAGEPVLVHRETT